jgi:hypothetical protein
MDKAHERWGTILTEDLEATQVGIEDPAVEAAMTRFESWRKPALRVAAKNGGPHE